MSLSHGFRSTAFKFDELVMYDEATRRDERAGQPIAAIAVTVETIALR